MNTAQLNPLTGDAYSANYWSLLQQRSRLPVYSIKKAFLQSLAASQWTVVVSLPGAGTQILQWAVQYIREKSGKQLVACSQPRRAAIAATARRVAEEMDVQVGEHVGYSIPFENCFSKKTVLKYCSDDELLRETAKNRRLDDYGVIIIDNGLLEEWTLQTDAKLALLNQILHVRPDIRVVVIAATIDSAACIHKYLDGCALVGLPQLFSEFRNKNNVNAPLIPPAVSRSDYVSLVLTLKKAGVRDLGSVDFLTKPSVEDLAAATDELYILGALDEDGAMTDRVPASTGAVRRSHHIGGSALFSRCTHYRSYACSSAASSARAGASLKERAHFYHPAGDYFTALNVYAAFRQDKELSHGSSMDAMDHDILMKVNAVRKEFARIMDKHGLRHSVICGRIPNEEDVTIFMKALEDLPAPTL